jgi:hypothetical protein
VRHELKCWPGAFDAIVDGRKRFEWRRDDRGFEVGDELLLKRWDPHKRYYTDPYPSILVRVTYILRGAFDVPHGFCVMSIEVAREGGK